MGVARAEESALNKEGFWTVGRGDPTSRACLASVPSADGGVFILQGDAGAVSFAVGAKSSMRRGKQGELVIDGSRFPFELELNAKRDFFFQIGTLDERAVAALKLAQGIEVLLEGRSVFSGEVASTGVENAVEAVVACSKGEKGWWGEGAVQATATAIPGSDAILNKEGVWSITVADGSVCVAQAQIDKRVFMQFLGANGGVGLAFGAVSGRLPKGRAGRVDAGGYAFDFAPSYNDDDAYMTSADMLDETALAILRRANRLKITVDRKALVETPVAGSGYPEILDAVAACSLGKSGWWGKGSKAP
ncbi:hypothetical protein [Phenylobacterium sp.]|uniref:hypothetical protein n=1 Tax=Phenylobacterium sp. TaxID=1871053 RepID=UPI0025D3D188|nr:hypothetical protein [Phenylobacterium sp.]